MIALRDFGQLPADQRGRALGCVKSVPEHFVIFGETSALLASARSAAESERQFFVHQPFRFGPIAQTSHSLDGKGFYLIEVDLSLCKTNNEVLKVIGKVLHFPDYYGRNWAALFDCMQDCLWLPAGEWVFSFLGMSALRARLPKAQSILMDGLFDINNPTSTGEDIDLTPKSHRKRFVFVFDESEAIRLRQDESYCWVNTTLPLECVDPVIARSDTE